MTGWPLPAETLGQHVAVLGKTGSGKTSTVKLAVERLAGAGDRVCILDPIKSDHWGLISSADGRRPGLPFAVLGGPKGHLALIPTAGAAIAEVVASGELPLSILDMRSFGPGDHARFFAAFAEALRDRMRGVLHLVIEEAHVFAPKERAGLGPETHAIHYAKLLATAGRSLGIRLIVATQRVQSLHNAVLGSCETLVAHRLTLPADQKPVLSWLKANAPPQVLADVAGELASLPTGTAWVCSGELGLFERVAFPRIATFDNSATPTREQAAIEVRAAPVDIAALRRILAAAAPAEPGPAKRAATTAAASVDEAVILQRIGEALAARDAQLRAVIEPHLPGLRQAMGAIEELAEAFAAALRVPARARLASDAPATPGRGAAAPRTGEGRPSPMVGRLLAAMRRAPRRELMWSEVALLAGASPVSGPFRGARNAAATSDQVVLLERGRDVAHAAWEGDTNPLLAEDVLPLWRAKLGSMAARVFAHLAESRRTATPADVAYAIDVSATSGPYRGAWKQLRNNLVVEAAGDGRWRLAAILRELPTALERAA